MDLQDLRVKRHSVVAKPPRFAGELLAPIGRRRLQRLFPQGLQRFQRLLGGYAPFFEKLFEAKQGSALLV